MNRTILLCGRLLITLLLVIGLFWIIRLMLLGSVALAPDVKTIVDGAVVGLITLVGFAVHAVFAPGAQVPENPTQAPQAPTFGVKSP